MVWLAVLPAFDRTSETRNNEATALPGAALTNSLGAHVKAQWMTVAVALAVMTGVGRSQARAAKCSLYNDPDYRTSGRVDSKSRGVIAAGNWERGARRPEDPQ